MKALSLLLFASVCSAQTSVSWTAESATTTWPTNGGFINIANWYDPISGTLIGWGQIVFTGHVSVTNGSNIATWVDGTKFSFFWHAPDQITVGAVQEHVATATIPSGGGCSATAPLICTQFTMAANWTGTTGTTTYSAKSQSIYGDTFNYYTVSTNTFTYGLGLGSLDNLCIPEAATGLPGMRQNNGGSAYDSKRGRLYMWGGANEGCKISVTSDGAGNITTTTGTSVCLSACFVQGGPWTSILVGFPTGSTCASIQCYPVLSVSSEKALVIDCNSITTPAACPASGSTSMQVYPAEQSQGTNALQDTGYLTLNSSPSSNTWTQVPITINTSFNTLNDNGGTYDVLDDGIVNYGVTTGSTWVFCTADGNPGGTLTSSQTGMGCVTPNQWAKPTVSGTNPPGICEPTLLWDTSINAIVQFGSGTNCSTAGSSQTDIYTYTPSTKTWAAKSSSSQPPQTHFSLYASEFIQVTAGTYLLHYPDTPTDYLYTLTSNAWTTLTTTGTGPTCVSPYTIAAGTACNTGAALGYDPAAKTLVAISQDAVGSPSGMYLWQGVLSGFGAGPTTNSAGGGISNTGGGIN